MLKTVLRFLLLLFLTADLTVALGFTSSKNLSSRVRRRRIMSEQFGWMDHPFKPAPVALNRVMAAPPPTTNYGFGKQHGTGAVAHPVSAAVAAASSKAVDHLAFDDTNNASFTNPTFTTGI
jgi:hypothetical protein